MNKKIKIYVASPLGFSEAGKKFYYEKLIPEIERSGFTAVDPWTLAPVNKIREVENMSYGEEKREAWQILNMEIGEGNTKNIDASYGLIAVLDGADVDSGTASEIGYAYAKGKPILGYRGDFRQAGDNEGGIVNLQVEYFIRASGGEIVTEFDELEKAMKNIFG